MAADLGAMKLEAVGAEHWKESDPPGDHNEVHLNFDTNKPLEYKLIHLPIYVLEYTYKGFAYRVFMNALTGSIEGYRQYDQRSITATTFGITSFFYWLHLKSGHDFGFFSSFFFVVLPSFLTGRFVERRPLRKLGRLSLEQIARESISEQFKSSTEQQLGGQSGGQLYSILGVSSTASQEQIKSAYKRLARQHHPDFNPQRKEEAAKKFAQISHAHSILSDENKRRDYDQFGVE